MRRYLLLAAVLIGLFCLLMACGGDAPPAAPAISVQQQAADQWRVVDQALADRVENLANAGEADAAGGVFAALIARPDTLGAPAEQRARLALARALIALGRNDDALTHLRGIGWADKSPAIATQILGLEARLRWQQLTIYGEVVSGAIPAIAAADAPFGEPGGPWLARREAYAALAEVLDRGVRLVKAEGGTPDLPASTEQLTLARFAFGDRTRSELATALGNPRTWSPALALAVLRVQLAEHEIDDAAAIASMLWDQHAAAPEAAEAFRRLRVWQLLRQRAASGLRLWNFPELESRITAAIATWPKSEQAARAELVQQQDVNEQAVIAASARSMGVSTESAVDDVEIPLDVADEESPVEARRFVLARDWPGLSMAPVSRIVSAGTPATVMVTSEHRGEHRLSVWRLKDAAAYDLLAREPAREHLPSLPLAEQVLTVAPWPSLGDRKSLKADLGILDEGFYAVSVTARGCPVVVMAGFTVSDVDLHAIAGSDGLVAWVVRRSDARGKAGEPLRAEFTLVRDPMRAAGPAWAKGDDAWRAGFRAAFLAIAEPAWQGKEDQAAFTAGRQAGSAAAVADPARILMVPATSDGDGLARWPLPEGFAGRGWKAQVAIDRPQVAVAAHVEHQTSGGWDALHLAWADKPVVRPGETLRFKALLRDWDGEVWHRPEGTAIVTVMCGASRLFAGEVAVSDVGTISGEVVIPPGCVTNLVRLAVTTATTPSGHNPGQQIAAVKDIGLPPGSLSVIDEGESDLRAGETRGLRIQVRDSASEPLAGAALQIHMRATDLATGAEVPCDSPKVVSDANGEAIVRIPSARDRELALVATISTRIADQRLVATSSWTTRLFPVPMSVELRKRAFVVGDLLHARVRLPAGAQVKVGLIRQGQLIGPSETVTGTGGWSEVNLALSVATQGAEALRLTAEELGGGVANRDLALTVAAPPAAADSPVRCQSTRATVLPGSTLTLNLGTTLPGRDFLVLGGTGAVLVTKVAHLAEPALEMELPVAGDWAPNLRFKALAWLPDGGFTASAPQEVAVLPVDRLLSVAALPDRTEYRTGSMATITVTVTDWKQRKVAGASLSIGLVDERLYTLGEDGTPDLHDWFTRQRRVWSLDEGSGAAIRDPQAELWRAVARRWGAHEGMFGSRSGGGRKRALGKFGGSVACEKSMRNIPVLPEADSTIHWSADIHTDAEGIAIVRVTLPENPGRFRITARANDASAAVLVGEIRGELVIREPLTCAVHGPTQAVDGDQLTLTAELASRLPTAIPVTVKVRRDGEATVLAQQTLMLPAGTRQGVALPVTVHLPPAGELRRVGDLLGRAVRLIVEVEVPNGERSLQAHHDVLLAVPGTPTVASLRLVADATGAIPQILAPAGSAVWLRVRAWPDAASRRREELLTWRKTSGPRGALAWLLAEAEPDRADELARRWPLLGNDEAASYVRLVARRMGFTQGCEMREITGSTGAWLLSRGRALGLTLPRPTAIQEDDVTSACAAAAIALHESAPGAGRRWMAVRERLDDGAPPLAIAFALDAAGVAGDPTVVQQLQAELATRYWTDELTAVIAADLLPSTGTTSTAAVVLHPGGPAVPLVAAEWTRWSGMVSADLRLSAAPGALLAVDTVVQRQPAKSGPQPEVQLLRLQADDGLHYVEVDPGSPVELGERLALRIFGCESYVLPALLQLATQGGAISRVDRFEETWKVPGSTTSEDPLQWFTEMTAVRTAVGVSEQALGADTIAAAGGRRVVPAGMVLVEARTLGACAVSGGARLRVVSDLPPAALAKPFPLIRQVQERYAAGCPEERALLLDCQARTVEEWQRLIALCDPKQVADLPLDQLVSHPLCGRRGHRTTIAARRWIDHEPAFERLGSDGAQQIVSLAGIVQLAAHSRGERQLAIDHQPFPGPKETSRPQPLRAWLERCQALALLTLPSGQSQDDWCWDQSLTREDLRSLGYGATVEEWVRFLGEELGFQVRIGRGVPGGVAQDDELADQRLSPSGARLGFAHLASAGLQLVAVKNGFELRGAGELPVQVSIVANNQPLATVVDRLNEQLKARGLAVVLYDPPAADHMITLAVRDMQPRLLIDYLVKITGATLENHGGRLRLRITAGE